MGKSTAVPFLLGGVVGAGIVAMIPAKEGKGKLSGFLLRYLARRKMRQLQEDMAGFAVKTGRQIAAAVEQGRDTLAIRKGGEAEPAPAGRKFYEENKGKIADFLVAGTGAALLLLADRSGKGPGKDLLKRDLLAFAVDTGRLLMDLRR